MVGPRPGRVPYGMTSVRTVAERLDCRRAHRRHEREQRELGRTMTTVSVRRATPDDAELAAAVVRESITRLCVADHQNDPVTLGSWLGNKTADSFVRWIASPDEHLVVA